MNTTCGFHFPNETLQRRQCTQRDWVNNSHVGHDSFEGDSGYFKWLWSCWIWHRRYCKYISFWSGGWRHLIVEVLDLNFAKKKKKKAWYFCEKIISNEISKTSASHPITNAACLWDALAFPLPDPACNQQHMNIRGTSWSLVWV